jgi:peptidoglycan/xylan/chitin deacetylase (PgdA/CDA1 family)
MYKSDNSIIALDWVLKLTGLLDWMRYRCRRGITVLMYHKVLPQQDVDRYPMRNLIVESSVFRSQISWLTKNFEVLTMRDAIRIAMSADLGISSRAKPLACVTFDDGYLDNYQFAAPILEEFGINGTFFVTTGFIDGSPLWFDRAVYAWQADRIAATDNAGKFVADWHKNFSAINTGGDWVGALKRCHPEVREKILGCVDYRLMKKDFVYSSMNWSQIRDLESRGHEIGSHSVTHPILTGADDANLQYELGESRERLISETGADIHGICYPNGNYDDRVIEFCKTAGYRYGCTVERGLALTSNNLMSLRRRAILSSGRPDPKLVGYEAEVVGFHDFLRNSKKFMRC